MDNRLHRIFNSSLANKALVSIGIRVAIVIAFMTAIAYYHVVSTMEEQSLSQLENYIAERVQRESNIFKLAEKNHAQLKAELLRRLRDFGDSDPISVFNKKTKKFQDGTIRTRLAGFDGTRDPFVFIGKDTKVNADIRRRVITFLNLSREYGAAWHHQFQNVYFTTPENLLVGYWPEVPSWAHSLPADTYMPNEEYVWTADKEHNPSRESVWTGLFYDVGGKIWMASLETPIDIAQRQIATIGHDVTLNELMKRTVNESLHGAYNIIMRKDGRLIAHPNKMKFIKEKAGVFYVSSSEDEQLKSIYKKIQTRKADQHVFKHKGFNEYFAIGTIKGPGWHFITVIPETLITGPAFETARIVLLLGIISLIVELIIFYRVLSRSVSNPIKEFADAVDLVAGGNMTVSVDSKLDNELGVLGKRFNHMTKSLQQRNEQLQFNIDMSNAMTRALSVYVTDQRGVSKIFSQMLEDILKVTNSEYGFIGEVHYSEEQPYLKTHSITDISWDEESKRLYKEYTELEGMEFRNLESLFGVVIKDKIVVISNDPANDPRSGGLPKGHPPLKSFLGMPLMLGDIMVGMVGIANCPQGYDPSRVNDLQPLLHTCSNVIDAYRKFVKSKNIENEMEQSRARFESMFESMSDAVVLADVDRKITLINKSVTNLLGYDESELLGKETKILYANSEDFNQTGKQRYNINAKGDPLPYEVEYQRKDGSTFWGETSGTKIVSEEGKFFGFLGMIRDISLRKQNEADLSKHRDHLEDLVKEGSKEIIAAKEEAERANEAKSDFLSRMSHELRTPMNAILGFGQLLELNNKDLNIIQQKNVTEILDAGNHLLELINDVLDLSRIESGSFEVSIEKVILADVLEQCLSLIQPLADSRQLELKDKLSDKGYCIQADYTRLKQIMLNLLSNAVKYNCDRGTIILEGKVINGHRLRISVTDTGKGLSDEDLSRLYKPFERLNVEENVEGTGIGLVITKNLVELMGGSIGVESKVEEGTSFWVELELV